MKTEKHIISLTAEEQIISLTDDLHAAYDTIRGLEIELEKCQMSDKSDTKSAERPTYKAAGLLVAMYAAKLNESVTELEKENAALLKRLEASDGWDDYNAIKALKDENAALRAAIDAARKGEQP